MAKGGLARRVEGLGDRSLPAVLSTLLALTSDAVVAFDGSGRVLMANEQAQALLPLPDEAVGTDVRSLFPPAVGVTPDEPFSLASLPFSCDGQASPVVTRTSGGARADLAVRCEEVGSAGTTYLLVAHAADPSRAQDQEMDRLVRELSRANKRLSGTLGIVLGTLDSDDVGELFQRVLEEITSTMEAWGTTFYLVDSDGYHLQGVSQSLRGVRVPRFVTRNGALRTRLVRSGHAVRLRVLAPGRGDLRRGHVDTRELVDEQTREVYKARAKNLPPFASFIAVPVWFANRVIALIEVGWAEVHPTRREDGELLDAVAQYLSVQLVGAVSAMRAKRQEQLQESASSIRERVISMGELTEGTADRALQAAADALDASCFALDLNAYQEQTVVLHLPGGEARSVPLDFRALGGSPTGDVAQALRVGEEGPLADALRGLGLPGRGVVLDVGRVADIRPCALFVRLGDDEPLDELDLAYLSRVAQDLHDLGAGAEARQQDRRISQALQTGMRNELQLVEGLTAQGSYTSATQQAVIGGDFYDLIALPQGRACVIMGDVSGKGVEAASVSAAVKTALGAYSWQGLSPARMVRLLNDFLLGFSRIETFATLFVGIVDVGTLGLTYCSAGHPPAMLLRAETGVIETLDVQSGVVGAFRDMTYRNGRVRLQRGDELLLYTDGTTEARSPEGAFFGEDGLRDAVMSEAPKGFDGLLDRLLGRLDAFTDRRLEDDVAMVAVRFDGLGEEGGEAAGA